MRWYRESRLHFFLIGLALFRVSPNSDQKSDPNEEDSEC